MKYIELASYSVYEHCKFDRSQNPTEYYRSRLISGEHTGLYYRGDAPRFLRSPHDDKTFFALYPSPDGPMIFFEGKNYRLHKDLDIQVHKDGKKRRFEIQDYGISINYPEADDIRFDIWSDEIDLDLFYKIEQQYKDDDFYKRYTRDFVFLE